MWFDDSAFLFSMMSSRTMIIFLNVLRLYFKTYISSYTPHAFTRQGREGKRGGGWKNFLFILSKQRKTGKKKIAEKLPSTEFFRFFLFRRRPSRDLIKFFASSESVICSCNILSLAPSFISEQERNRTEIHHRRIPFYSILSYR